jgi:phosphoenolpyruvate phosphomutase
MISFPFARSIANVSMVRSSVLPLRPIKVIGAFDGLTAILATEAGADALWASGFSISASKGIGDCSLLSSEDLCARVADIISASTLPTIVDCDEGHGSTEASIRLAKRLAELGAFGICLEDNEFPKVNSFVSSVSRQLLSAESFSERVRALKSEIPQLFLIARTEAIVAGLGLKESVRRGTMYANAGADAIVLHSTATTLSTLRDYRAAWKSEVPLCVIPTAATDATFDALAALGYSLIIYANHVLRISIAALQQQLRFVGVSPKTLNMVPLEEVFRLAPIRPRH